MMNTRSLSWGLSAIPQHPMGSQRVGITPDGPHTHREGRGGVWATLGTIGLPGTGKSTCALSLLFELKENFPVINVFSGSEGDNPF